MNSSNWKDIAELVGIAAIVASLMFVGLQMKQSQEIAIATQYQSRAETTMGLYQTYIEIDYLPPGILYEMQDLGLDEAIPARDMANILWALTAYDNHHYQYQAGFLSGDAWDGLQRRFAGILTSCQTRPSVDWMLRGARSEFITFVRSQLDPCAAPN